MLYQICSDVFYWIFFNFSPISTVKVLREGARWTLDPWRQKIKLSSYTSFKADLYLVRQPLRRVEKSFSTATILREEIFDAEFNFAIPTEKFANFAGINFPVYNNFLVQKSYFSIVLSDLQRKVAVTTKTAKLNFAKISSPLENRFVPLSYRFFYSLSCTLLF